MHTFRLFKIASFTRHFFYQKFAPAALLGLILLAPPAEAAELWKLEEFLETRGLPTGMFTGGFWVSDDLNSALVLSDPPSQQEFQWWTAEQELQPTGFFNGGNLNRRADIIPNGSGFFSFLLIGEGVDDDRLVRWSPSGGVELIDNVAASGQRLGSFSPGSVSYDGMRVVGTDFSSPEVSRWSDGFGTEFIATGTRALVSGDGSTTVFADIPSGSLSDRIFKFHRKVDNGPVELLAELQTESQTARLQGVSFDGDAFIMQPASFLESGWIWTAENGLSTLDGLFPNAISPDGRIVYGHTDYNDGESVAAVWDPVNGTRPFREVLVDEYGLGEALDGWELGKVQWTYMNGHALSGLGTNPAGEAVRYLVILNPIPEPVTAALVALSLAGFCFVRRRTPFIGGSYVSRIGRSA